MVKIDPVQSEPLELGDGTFLLGAMGHVMRLEAATGNVLWKTPFAGGTFEFRQTDARPDVVYVGAEEVEQTLGCRSDDAAADADALPSFQARRWRRGLETRRAIPAADEPFDHSARARPRRQRRR